MAAAAGPIRRSRPTVLAWPGGPRCRRSTAEADGCSVARGWTATSSAGEVAYRPSRSSADLLVMPARPSSRWAADGAGSSAWSQGQLSRARGCGLRLGGTASSLSTTWPMRRAMAGAADRDRPPRARAVASRQDADGAGDVPRPGLAATFGHGSRGGLQMGADRIRQRRFREESLRREDSREGWTRRSAIFLIPGCGCWWPWVSWFRGRSTGAGSDRSRRF